MESVREEICFAADDQLSLGFSLFGQLDALAISGFVTRIMRDE